jgi:hypothetical protein
MNKEQFKKQLESIEEMFSTADKVKGEKFTDMVRFVGTIQSFGMMMMTECRRLGASDEHMESLTERCALFSSALCGAHSKAIGLSIDEFDEVFQLADKIDNKIHEAFKD